MTTTKAFYAGMALGVIYGLIIALGIIAAVLLSK